MPLFLVMIAVDMLHKYCEAKSEEEFHKALKPVLDMLSESSQDKLRTAFSCLFEAI